MTQAPFSRTHRQVLLLDLADDAAFIREYIDCHKPGGVPADVLDDIRASGITAMAIYHFADRLVMIAETDGEQRADNRVVSAAVQAWEARMDRLQRPLDAALAGVKWQPAEKIFDLTDHQNTRD